MAVQKPLRFALLACCVVVCLACPFVRLYVCGGPLLLLLLLLHCTYNMVPLCKVSLLLAAYPLPPSSTDGGEGSQVFSPPLTIHEDKDKKRGGEKAF